MPARVLFLVLEAADFQVMKRLESQGLLPEIQALSHTSLVTPVARPEEVTDDAVWASFQYALPLGEHGRWYWERERSDGSGTDFNADGEEGLTSWWEPLAAGGARVAIFDVPKLRPGPIPNGIFSGNWLVHGRYGTSVEAFPEAQGHDLGDEPDPSLLACSTLEEINLSVDAKLNAALLRLRSRNWDFFATSFQEIHAAAHAYCHIEGPQTLSDPLSSRLIHSWKSVDEALGLLRKAAGEECEVVLYSTTGMSANRSVDHHAKDILRDINQRLSSRHPLHQMFGRGGGEFVQQLPFNESSLARRVHRRAGLAHRKLVDFVIAQLAELRVEGSGAPVFSGFVRMSQDYLGARQRDLPDVLGVQPLDLGHPPAIRSPRIGRLENDAAIVRWANHAGDGFLVHPRSIRPAGADGDASTTIKIEDIGPMLSARVAAQSQRGRDAAWTD